MFLLFLLLFSSWRPHLILLSSHLSIPRAQQHQHRRRTFQDHHYRRRSRHKSIISRRNNVLSLCFIGVVMILYSNLLISLSALTLITDNSAATTFIAQSKQFWKENYISQCRYGTLHHRSSICSSRVQKCRNQNKLARKVHYGVIETTASSSLRWTFTSTTSVTQRQHDVRMEYRRPHHSMKSLLLNQYNNDAESRNNDIVDAANSTKTSSINKEDNKDDVPQAINHLAHKFQNWFQNNIGSWLKGNDDVNESDNNKSDAARRSLVQQPNQKQNEVKEQMKSDGDNPEKSISSSPFYANSTLTTATIANASRDQDADKEEDFYQLAQQQRTEYEKVQQKQKQKFKSNDMIDVFEQAATLVIQQEQMQKQKEQHQKQQQQDNVTVQQQKQQLLPEEPGQESFPVNDTKATKHGTPKIKEENDNDDEDLYQSVQRQLIEYDKVQQKRKRKRKSVEDKHIMDIFEEAATIVLQEKQHEQLQQQKQRSMQQPQLPDKPGQVSDPVNDKNVSQEITSEVKEQNDRNGSVIENCDTVTDTKPKKTKTSKASKKKTVSAKKVDNNIPSPVTLATKKTIKLKKGEKKSIKKEKRIQTSDEPMILSQILSEQRQEGEQNKSQALQGTMQVDDTNPSLAADDQTVQKTGFEERNQSDQNVVSFSDSGTLNDTISSMADDVSKKANGTVETLVQQNFGNVAITDGNDDNDDDEFSDEEWEAAIQMAQNNIDGKIIGWNNDPTKKSLQQKTNDKNETSRKPDQEKASEMNSSSYSMSSAANSTINQTTNVVFQNDTKIDGIAQATREAVTAYEQFEQDQRMKKRVRYQKATNNNRSVSNEESHESNISNPKNDTLPATNVFVEWNKRTLKELRNELQLRGLPTTGKKEQLIRILQNTDQQQQKQEESNETKNQENNETDTKVDQLVIDDDGKDNELDYQKMSIAQLKDECKKRNISIKVRIKKSELIAILVDQNQQSV